MRMPAGTARSSTYQPKAYLIAFSSLQVRAQRKPSKNKNPLKYGHIIHLETSVWPLLATQRLQLAQEAPSPFYPQPDSLPSLFPQLPPLQKFLGSTPERGGRQKASSTRRRDAPNPAPG